MPSPKSSPIIVIFGITGDLSKRYLIPALYHMFSDGLLDEQTKIIGTSRKPLDKDEFAKTIELSILAKDKSCDPAVLEEVKTALDVLQLDPEKDEDYLKLKSAIERNDPGNGRIRMLYMSVPAKAYGPIVDHLASNGLKDSQTRLLLEKPFGYDLKSAKELIDLVNASFNEDQVYRIDHYLAKETAQNLLAFRLHNPIFKSIWSGAHIDKVHIRLLETIGIEGRANFYEQTGALRDIIQSHAMQLLSIVMMDLPENMTSQAIHASKQKFFSMLSSADPKLSVRGQYDSYREEVNKPDSTAETYAKISLSSTDKNWQGTQIILETGKALSEHITEVVVSFKTAHERRFNELKFQIQPDEGICLDLIVREPGLDNNMHKTALDFSYAKEFSNYVRIDAYERVLFDAINGDQSLFASDKEVLETWRVLEPVLNYWQSNSDQLHFYTVGSKGLSLT